jgi:hypothetical protein
MVIKNQFLVIILAMMAQETTQERRKRLLTELEKYGVQSNHELDLVQDITLEKVLQILKGNKDTKTVISNDDSSQWYASMLADYIYKMTVALVLFFATYPGAAFWWPPYYFYPYQK